MSAVGRVRWWLPEQGWGVIESEATPGGCWVHASAVAAPAIRALEAGTEVDLEWEPAAQDGYSFRATAVWPRGGRSQRPRAAEHRPPSSAYRSSLTIDFEP